MIRMGSCATISREDLHCAYYRHDGLEEATQIDRLGSYTHTLAPELMKVQVLRRVSLLTLVEGQQVRRKLPHVLRTSIFTTIREMGLTFPTILAKSAIATDYPDDPSSAVWSPIF